ncbi:RNA-binding protein [Caldalkalibacillus mannanilyticus]|uniref:YlmH family RNA-binding protein n=1 Tax=Caldalkalibacillus mannanilyticus TaxID=1418 RepID=UPI000468ABE4|nr:YlmH/Sll1252 family protein [Caldalkalibacillus mannanilyticus]
MTLYAHFRPEEKPLVERILEWTELVSDRKTSKLTPFLDPREQFIVRSIVGRTYDVKVSFFGGYMGAERQRAMLTPEYVEVSPEDFQVTLLSIQPKQKSITLTHRDVLGSLLGLGIKREKFGDILLTDSAQQCLVSQDISSFVLLNLQQIHRYAIQCESIPLHDIVPAIGEWKYKETTVSSLRLDVVLSELLSLSRAKVAPLIKGGRVKVNWKVTEHSSLQLEAGDIVSVKGFGRFLFSAIEGITKKQKFRVVLGEKKA